MHKCVRCGRIAASLAEIDAGCPCGSKVFIFGREDPIDTPLQPGLGATVTEASKPVENVPEPAPMGAEAKPEAAEREGRAPDSYHARMSFTSEDVENIKVVREGVFLLDVNALSRDPMVLKDEEGIYYVKIPFEQRKPLVPSGGNGTKGNGGSGINGSSGKK